MKTIIIPDSFQRMLVDYCNHIMVTPKKLPETTTVTTVTTSSSEQPHAYLKIFGKWHEKMHEKWLEAQTLISNSKPIGASSKHHQPAGYISVPND